MVTVSLESVTVQWRHSHSHGHNPSTTTSLCGDNPYWEASQACFRESCRRLATTRATTPPLSCTWDVRWPRMTLWNRPRRERRRRRGRTISFSCISLCLWWSLWPGCWGWLGARLSGCSSLLWWPSPSGGARWWRWRKNTSGWRNWWCTARGRYGRARRQNGSTLSSTDGKWLLLLITR